MTDRLLTTTDVASVLVVSEEFVREHAAELGAVKLGQSRGAPLRFERRRVEAWLEERRLGRSTPRRRPGRAQGSAGVALLPLPDGAR